MDAAFTLCGEDPRRGDFAGQSQSPLNSYGSTVVAHGYSVEEQLAARMRFLAQRPMVRYTIRRSLGGLKSVRVRVRVRQLFRPLEPRSTLIRRMKGGVTILVLV